MLDRDKQILETFAVVIPKLSESDKKYLLGLGNGMAIKIEQQEKKNIKAKEMPGQMSMQNLM